MFRYRLAAVAPASGASGGFQARGENFHGGVTTSAAFSLEVNP